MFCLRSRLWQSALAALFFSTSTMAFSIGQKPLRILVVGDSMTHQKEGDFTWRFRLWQWFQQENIAVEFVGPYHGTSLDIKNVMHEELESRAYWDTGVNWDGGYAPFVDAEFLDHNSYHYAAAGRPMYFGKDTIEEVLKLHPADMLLVMLGINDLAFCCWAGDVVKYGEDLVANARKVNPNIKIAFSNAPYQSFLTRATKNTIEYNEYLPGNVTKWSTAQSPVHLVDIANTYGCGSCDCPAGFDGLHPNAWGDFHIAHAFSETLIKQFGMGSCPVEIPDREKILVRYLPAPNKLKVFSSKTDVVALWDGVYGAYQYRLEITKNGGSPEAFDLGQNYWSAPIEDRRTKYSIRVAALAQQQVSNWTEPVLAVYSDDVHTPMRDLSIDSPASTSFRREDDFPCVGNTPPKQKSCSAWRQENPYSAPSSDLRIPGFHIGYLLLLVFVVLFAWLGYRMLSSRNHRKYFRLDGWRNQDTAILSDDR